MKHKHYEIIVAKAANVDLVVFVRDGSHWNELNFPVAFYEINDYFLCLPQHKEACLHWLNGGEAQTDRSFDEFVSIDEALNCKFKWWDEGWFMQQDYKSRIKPKKEKRWLTYNKKSHCISSGLMSTVPECIREGDQLIEIEVEV